MFWTDWGGILRSKIERADLTGENRQTLVNFHFQGFPINVVIEFKPERIYWMEHPTEIVQILRGITGAVNVTSEETLIQ